MSRLSNEEIERILSIKTSIFEIHMEPDELYDEMLDYIKASYKALEIADKCLWLRAKVLTEQYKLDKALEKQNSGERYGYLRFIYRLKKNRPALVWGHAKANQNGEIRTKELSRKWTEKYTLRHLPKNISNLDKKLFLEYEYQAFLIRRKISRISEIRRNLIYFIKSCEKERHTLERKN